MCENSTIDKYLELFKKMNRAQVRGYKAPHKPVLLLAIIKMVENGMITSPKIILSENLVKEFKNMWLRLVDNEQGKGPIIVTKGLELTLSQKYPFKCNICNPFFHMQHEPFWNLVQKDNWVRKSDYNQKELLEYYQYAEIDQELFMLMKVQVSRAQLINCLVDMI